MTARSALIVHPQAALAERIATALRDVGLTPTIVPDGERAIDRFVQQPFDAVIVELLLPGRDGGATVESIRWAPGGDRVAVVLTATGAPRTKLDDVARQVGAVGAFAGDIDARAVAALLRDLPPARDDEPWSEDPRKVPTRPGQKSPPAPAMFHDDLYEDGEIEESTLVDGPNDPIAPDPTAAREGRDVELRASYMSKTEPGIEGRLSSLAFPKLLSLLAQRRVTGALALEADEADRRATTTGESGKKVVFFRNGVPLHVRSNLVEECLGQVLLRIGRINRTALEESLARVREGEGRQGGILVAMGAITPHDLREALEQQQRIKLFDVFSWPDGGFRFSDRMEPPSEVVTLEMALNDIVYEGVVHHIAPPRLLEQLEPHLGAYVIPVRRRAASFMRMDIPADARRILLTIDGTTTLREVLALADPRPGAAAQLMYALECVGGIELTAAPRSVGRLQPDEPEGSSADLGGLRNLGAVREELHRLGRLLREERYAEALGVQPNDVAGAQRAQERLDMRLRPVTVPGAAPRDLRALAFEVLARLVRARRAIEGDHAQTVLARQVVEALGRPETSEHAVDDVERDPSAKPIEGVPTKTEAPSAKPIEAVPTRTGTASAKPLDGVPTKRGPSPFESITQEHDYDQPTPSEATPSDDVRHEIITVEGPAPVPTQITVPQVTLADRPPIDDASRLDELVQRMSQAERHFRSGERAVHRERWEEAVSNFEKAVELCPEEGEFLVWLGYARAAASEDDGSRDRALDELARGCRLAPKLDVAHLLRARVLRDGGDIAGARNAYERALAANPDCTEALEGLRELAKP